MRFPSWKILASYGAFLSALTLCATASYAQTALPQIDVTVASPIARRAPAGPAPAQPGSRQPEQTQPTATPAAAPETLQGTIPIVTDQFATITVVPNAELRRNGASTLGDLSLRNRASPDPSFAPGASSRPIIRGLDVNRVRIQENGIGANGASDLGEDHFVPVDPLTSDQVEVIRGPGNIAFWLAGDRRRRRDRPTIAFRRTFRRAASVRRIPWRGNLQSTMALTARRCSMRAAETLPFMPMSSAAQRRTTASRVIRI